VHVADPRRHFCLVSFFFFLLQVMEIIKRAGIPDGVVQIVNGTVPVVEAICDHPDIPAISFVGSSKVAEIVAHRGRKNNKRVLALGAAKNHLVALRDCNADMCSTDIMQSFTGCAGQRCMAASALITVQQQDDLIAQIVAKASKLTPGQGAGQMGPIIDQAAVDRCHRYIEEAVSKNGAKLLLDGRSWTNAQPGYWIGPTILFHTSAQDPAFREEIFGPILSIVQVETREEAVAIENASPYGNAACIYTTVGAHAEWFTARFSAGMVGVNIGVPVPREPFSFGGWNASRYGDLDITGEGGLEFWTRRKKITTKWNVPSNRGTGDWMS
jgi:acyl-CoA reductase-like NAD-dependent aldehyde dehydrogenase